MENSKLYPAVTPVSNYDNNFNLNIEDPSSVNNDEFLKDNQFLRKKVYNTILYQYAANIILTSLFFAIGFFDHISLSFSGAIIFVFFLINIICLILVCADDSLKTETAFSFFVLGTFIFSRSIISAVSISTNGGDLYLLCASLLTIFIVLALALSTNQPKRTVTLTTEIVIVVIYYLICILIAILAVAHPLLTTQLISDCIFIIFMVVDLNRIIKKNKPKSESYIYISLLIHVHMNVVFLVPALIIGLIFFIVTLSSATYISKNTNLSLNDD